MRAYQATRRPTWILTEGELWILIEGELWILIEGELWILIQEALWILIQGGLSHFSISFRHETLDSLMVSLDAAARVLSKLARLRAARRSHAVRVGSLSFICL